RIAVALSVETAVSQLRQRMARPCGVAPQSKLVVATRCGQIAVEGGCPALRVDRLGSVCEGFFCLQTLARGFGDELGGRADLAGQVVVILGTDVQRMCLRPRSVRQQLDGADPGYGRSGFCRGV